MIKLNAITGNQKFCISDFKKNALNLAKAAKRLEEEYSLFVFEKLWIEIDGIEIKDYLLVDLDLKKASKIIYRVENMNYAREKEIELRQQYLDWVYK